MENMQVKETGTREHYIKLADGVRLNCTEQAGGRRWAFERVTQRGDVRGHPLSDLGEPGEVRDVVERTGLCANEHVVAALVALQSLGAHPETYGVSRKELDELRAGHYVREIVMKLPIGRPIGKGKVVVEDGGAAALVQLADLSDVGKALVRDLTRSTSGKTVSAWVSLDAWANIEREAKALRRTPGEVVAAALRERFESKV
jgi:hypothetical protein